MSDYDRAFYQARATNRRALATAAVDPKIAALHIEMAEQYDLLASSNAGVSTGLQTVE